MSSYRARWEEIRAEIRTPEAADLNELDSARLSQAQARYSTFLNLFPSYLDWRDRILNEAIGIIREESSSATAAAQQAKWADTFAKAGDEAYRRVMDCARDTETLTPQLRQWALGAAAQESQFLWQIGRAPLAEIAGRLQEYLRQFQTEKTNLEGKWKALGDQDRPIDNKVAETSRQVAAQFGEVVAGLLQQQRGLPDKIKDIKYDPTQPITGSLFNILGHLAKMLAEKVGQDLDKLKKTTQSYVDTLTDMYRAEDQIVVIFTQQREAVREFLSKTNLDVAVKAFNEAKGNALQAAGNCSTTRLREDAKRYIETALPAAEAHMDKLNREFTGFVSANQGIFIGPIINQKLEHLLQISQRNGYWKDIEAVSVQSKLEEIYAGFPGVDVNIDGLTDGDKDKLKTFWQAQLEPMMRGIVAAKDDRLRDRIPEYFKDQLGGLWNRIIGSKGGLE